MLEIFEEKFEVLNVCGCICNCYCDCPMPEQFAGLGDDVGDATKNYGHNEIDVR